MADKYKCAVSIAVLKDEATGSGFSVRVPQHARMITFFYISTVYGRKNMQGLEVQARIIEHLLTAVCQTKEDMLNHRQAFALITL